MNIIFHTDAFLFITPMPDGFQELVGQRDPTKDFTVSLGVSPQSLESLRPVPQAELEQRQLNQAASMRAMTQEELAVRYGGSLANAYRPSEDSKS